MSDDFRFYKFKPIDKWLIESIVKNSLYVPSLEQLNDPFDCQINLENLLELSISLASEREKDFISNIRSNKIFIENFNNQISSFGVYSVSIHEEDILQETLMWSHYADKHKGVCLEYHIPEHFCRSHLLSPGYIAASGAVIYEENDLAKRVTQLPLRNEEFSSGLAWIYLLSKNKSWKYEKEGRLITWKPGIIDIPKLSLKRIYFGLNANPSDIELVATLAHTYSGCEEYYLSRKGKGLYDIEFEKKIA